MPEIPTTAIERIRREVFQLTQKEFSEILQVSPSTLSKWEKGEGEPSRKELELARQAATSQGLPWNDEILFASAPTAEQIAQARTEVPRTKIKRIREDVFGITQQEMSEIMGCSQGALSRWENGDGEPGLSEMRLCREAAIARKLPWDDAWFFEGPPPADDLRNLGPEVQS